MKTVTLCAAAIAAASVPAAAEAATYAYTLTGPSGGAYSARWELDSNPTPDSVYPGQGFAIERVTGDFAGSTAGAAYLDFFSAANGGGLSISDADGPDLLFALTGAALYLGSEAAPTMRLGTFSLSDSNSTDEYSLQVVAVPEPATWAMLILGFGVVGGAMRTRRLAVRYV